MTRTTFAKLFALQLLVSFPVAVLQAQPPDNKGNPSQTDKDKKSNHGGNEKTSHLGDKEKKSGQGGAKHDEESILVAAGIRLAYEEARRHAEDCGLVGQKPIPPGIRKNLARGKPMPPGIAKTRLGANCAARFPSADDYDWYQAGADLVLLAVADNVVSGVLRNVFE